MKFLILLFLAIHLIFQSSYADSGDDIAKLYFRAFSWGSDIKDIYYQDIHGKERKLHLFIDKISEEYYYEGPYRLSFYQKEKDGKKRILSHVKFKKELSDQLILFFHNKSGKNLKNLVYGNSKKGFPKGSLRLYNFTKKNIAMKLGDQIIAVSPLKSKVIHYLKNRGEDPLEFSNLYDSNTPMAMNIGVESSKDHWSSTFRSSWPRKPDARTHFFIFPIGNERYRFHHLFELNSLYWKEKKNLQSELNKK
jgi:hypothetical protein